MVTLTNTCQFIFKELTLGLDFSLLILYFNTFLCNLYLFIFSFLPFDLDLVCSSFSVSSDGRLSYWFEIFFCYIYIISHLRTALASSHIFWYSVYSLTFVSVWSVWLSIVTLVQFHYFPLCYYCYILFFVRYYVYSLSSIMQFYYFFNLIYFKSVKGQRKIYSLL